MAKTIAFLNEIIYVFARGDHSGVYLSCRGITKESQTVGEGDRQRKIEMVATPSLVGATIVVVFGRRISQK